MIDPNSGAETPEDRDRTSESETTMPPPGNDAAADLSSVSIRPATPADAAGCLALQREYFPDYVRTTGVSNLDTLRLATVIREAPADRSAWFVATHNDEVVGYAFGQPWTPRRESPFSSNCMAALPQVAVRDGFQGHGIGSALVTEVIGAMAHLGFEMIHAHIPAHLVRWYAAGGMNVLQSGAGLAWVEMPGPGSEHLAPTDWTAEERAADTPRLGIRPDGNGYDHICFAQLAPLQKLIWATPYSTDGNLVRNAARTMLRLSLEVPTELFVARLSQALATVC